jgi:AAA family ATP:ADP antiporter
MRLLTTCHKEQEMSQTASVQEFGKIRSILWPVYGHELKKIIPMILIFFLITFNYNFLRNAKDAMVITAQNSDAGVIPFIKVWALLPMAFVMTFIFTRLANRFRKEVIFYWMVSIFIGFFFLFITVLYPLRDYLHPTDLADKMALYLPSGLKGFVAMFRNWTFTLFYVMSELWGSIMLQLLFWGFANDVTNVKDAKRFYGLFGIGANFSGIFAGQASMYLSSIASTNLFAFSGMSAWTQSLVLLHVIVILVGLGIIAVFRWLNVNVIAKEPLGQTVSKFKKPKIKMSMKENFSYLAKSKYLICIAVIVLVYNVVINLTEVVWKAQVHRMYTDNIQYQAYMGKVATITCIVATLTAFFITSNVIRKTGWTVSALITPIVLLLTTIGFFSFLLFDSLGAFVAPLLHTTPFALALFFGTCQNCMSRAAKYTLFDATKEMTFIPLSQESKIKGKAAIDGVGSRLGKSGGAMIYHLLLLFIPLTQVAPYVAVLLIGFIGAWIASVKNLGKLFNKQATLNESEEKVKTLKEQAQLQSILKEEKAEEEETLVTKL